jgi:hypothetical protein
MSDRVAGNRRYRDHFSDYGCVYQACTSKLWRIVVISGGRLIARLTTFGCCIVLLVGGYEALGQQSAIPKDALKVRIDSGKKQFHVGDPLQFSIMITNVGSQSFLVPNHVSLMDNTMSVLAVDLRTQAGQHVPGLGSAYDCAEYKPTKLLFEDVFADYILLRPGTSYVQQFSLDEAYPRVGPGKYSFTTKYVAYFAAKGCKTWTEDDIDKFPFLPWYGSTAANDVSFEILPNPKMK